MSQYPYPAKPILVVDDEPTSLRVIELSLREEGVSNIVTLVDSRQVMGLLAERSFSVVSLDLSMPCLSGEEVLREISENFPGVVVTVLTANYDVDKAVECMRLGAFDYIRKTVSSQDLVTRLRRAIHHSETLDEADRLKSSMLTDKVSAPEAFAKIVTRSPKMLNIFKYVEAMSETGLTILITGETGTGKELLAEAVHRASGREGLFVPVNVAGLDDNMFTDALFGHVKGAFTGADRPRKGFLSTAENGTLFLDEIGDLKPESQVKLLRLLQERRYYPSGSDTPIMSTARIVAATNRDLKAMSQTGAFRKDLYYRLQAHQIHLPALRDRKEDLPLLAQSFLTQAAEELGKKVPVASNELYDILNAYGFPGNIRELRGAVYHAVSASRRGALPLRLLREKLFGEDSPRVFPSTETPTEAGEAPEERRGTLCFPDTLPTLKAVSAALIEEALRRAKNNKTLAASMLGLTRQGLQNRLKRLDQAE